MSSINFYINSKLILSNTEYTILQACSAVGVEIPRFCYHPALSVAANCRMCLVEVEGSSKPVASCAMQVSPGIRVNTLTFFVKKAREAVLEFLLINHPLDCPICDQGGECDLQDQTLVFGSDRGRFYEKKRAVKNFFAGWLVKTFMTRCIHCTRCVRFNSEVELESKLGSLGRGSFMKISNFVGETLRSGFSGNLIDLCPVGALVSKPYSFTARPWELRTLVSIDFSNPLFSKIRLDMKGDEIKRVLPSTTDSSESFMISDKARFFFDGLFYQRIAKPSANLSKDIKIWPTAIKVTSISYLHSILIKHSQKTKQSKNHYREQEVSEVVKSLNYYYRENKTFFSQGASFFSVRSKKSGDFVLFSKKLGLAQTVKFYLSNVGGTSIKNSAISNTRVLDLILGGFFEKQPAPFLNSKNILDFFSKSFLNYG